VEDLKKQIVNQEERVEDINNWMDQEADKVMKRNILRNQLEILVESHEDEMTGIKKEKSIAIDKLRKEML
jgi:gluconate kinase